MTNFDVRCKALTGPGGSLTSAFNAPSTTIRASFLKTKLKHKNFNSTF